jgi:hypothetical protein
MVIDTPGRLRIQDRECADGRPKIRRVNAMRYPTRTRMQPKRLVESGDPHIDMQGRHSNSREVAMTQSVAASDETARTRTFTWEDPLIGAHAATKLSGLGTTCVPWRTANSRGRPCCMC